MNKYEVLGQIKIKVGERLKEFQPGRIIKLPVQSAQKLIETGKIRLLEETKQDRLTQVFDEQTCKSKSKYNLNPDRKPCKRCGRPAERFCYDMYHKGYPTCNWFCLDCEPYHFN